MEVIIRRGLEKDMLAVRDILNHYILNTAVTFEMVELSLENRKLGLPIFGNGAISVICGRRW